MSRSIDASAVGIDVMDIQIVAGNALTAAQEDTWRSVMQSDPALNLPLLHPRFISAVAKVREDVNIGVLSEGPDIVGFFPYQMSRYGAGRFAGGALADHQSVIAAPDVTVDVAALMHACGLKTFEFDRMIASQGAFAAWHTTLNDAGVIDLPRGVEQYHRRMSSNADAVWRRAQAAHDRLCSGIGPLAVKVAFEAQPILDLLSEWRSRRPEKRCESDVLDSDWAARLVRLLMAERDAELQVTATTLVAQGRPVAVRLGLRYGELFHEWFAAGDPALASDLPSLVLLTMMIENASRDGIGRITLGRGASIGARRLANASVTLAEGFAEYPPRVPPALPASVEPEEARSWVRRWPWNSVITMPGRLVRREWRRRGH